MTLGMRAGCGFVWFCFCLVFYSSRTKTCIPFCCIKRMFKWTVGSIVYHLFLHICELNMQEWVSIYETNEYDIGTLDIYRFLQVDGLSTGPLGFGVSQKYN